MTKDELKAEAKKLGTKVRESFMDDVIENVIWMAIGALGGFLLARLF